MIQLREVSLTVKGKRLLNHLNYDFHDGKVYGLLGPNGAGKTTLLKTMIGLTASEGSVLIDGHPARAEEFGSLIEYPAFYPRLTARENLDLHIRYRGDRGVSSEEALAMVGLAHACDLQVRKMSLGMRQRLGIARACLGSARHLLLDEPTNGLDPLGIRDVRKLLQGPLRKPDRCIIVSSHNLREVAAIADELVFVRGGSIVATSPDAANADALETLYESAFKSPQEEVLQ